MTPDKFRDLALAIPGAVEGVHMGHADFRIHGKVFATLGYPDENFGMIKLSPPQQRSLIKKSPASFAPSTGAWGKNGSTSVTLARAKIGEVREALECAAGNLTVKSKAGRVHQSTNQNMKAVALTRYLPISDPQSLLDVELPKPSPASHDLLVRVEAISVNPVDTKVRTSKQKVETEPRVLGWDAAGVVEAVGPAVTRFKAGDEVYYAGDVTRPGCNSEFQLVDARIVGHKPRTLSFAEAAAMPLTSITAWEALFDRMGIDPRGKNHGQSLLIIGGAGGMGSIGIQLAKRAGLVVIATASRPETRKWVTDMGADHVVDHRQPLPPQLTALGFRDVHFIANFSDTDAYWNVAAELIRPQGKIVALVDNKAPLDLKLLKSKSATFVWEFMFTRSMFQTHDMDEQGKILNEVAALLDARKLRTTLTQTISPINAANLRQAHAQLESGKTIGKLALVGWH